MITEDMMMFRMFKRLCSEQVIMAVHYQSKKSDMNLRSIPEEPIHIKVGKFVSIEKFIVIIKVGRHIQMKFLVTQPPKFNHNSFKPKSILETGDGTLTIEYCNS